MVNGAILVFIGTLIAVVGFQTVLSNPTLGISMTLIGAYVVTALFWNDIIKHVYARFYRDLASRGGATERASP